MKISYILPTICQDMIGIKALVQSISIQKDHDHEIIIVDQSKNFCCEQLKSFPNVIYIKSNVQGLSHCRNIGLSQAQGDIIAFPDDDCFYDETTINIVLSTFTENPKIDIILGRQVDPNTNSSPKFQGDVSDNVSIKKLNYYGNSVTIFVRCLSDNFKSITFDERFGAGTYFGSHEETDYLLQHLKYGANILYQPDIIIYHLIDGYSDWEKDKTISYARGMGAYYKKNCFEYTFSLLTLVLRPFVGCLLACFQFDYHKARYRYWRLIGNIAGFITYH